MHTVLKSYPRDILGQQYKKNTGLVQCPGIKWDPNSSGVWIRQGWKKATAVQKIQNKYY